MSLITRNAKDYRLAAVSLSDVQNRSFAVSECTPNGSDAPSLLLR